ncbi:carbonic anhydrase [Parathielavia hyrcaniae]|uniref:Carbonic anhydrase n=1 Tax=Parathielavia hyrcaniae TaxID=113614 RepID=A0AAN6SZ09_9PEZI|nr:carbonic anhydrase [Parathielavia hyrcaniae]
MFNSRVGTSATLLQSLTRRTIPRQARPFLFPPSTRLAPPHLRRRSFASSAARPNTKTDWRAMAENDITQYLRQTHDRVFEHNCRWAADCKAKDPDYFVKLSAGQTPEYLWIGCSDSRIPAEQITGLEPGDAFVHRNIANLVCNTDLNVMSVITYAVEHLKVKHIVVCGHYGCGGVKAAMTPKDLGLLNPWLRNIRDVYRLHEQELDAIADDDARYNRLVELNVYEQCRNVVKSASVQQSFAKNKFPVVHGWVFGFNDGLLKDLKVDFEGMLKDIQKIYNLTES